MSLTTQRVSYRNVFNPSEINKIQRAISYNQRLIDDILKNEFKTIPEYTDFKVTTAYKTKLSYKHRQYKLVLFFKTDNKPHIITEEFIYCVRCKTIKKKYSANKLKEISKCCKNNK